MTLEEMQKRVVANKKAKGFDMTNIDAEFCLLYGEAAEAYDAYIKKKDDLGLELADVALYLLSLAEMLGYSLHDEIEKKMTIIEKRVYKKINGVWVKGKDEE